MRTLLTIIVAGAIGFVLYNSRTEILQRISGVTNPAASETPDAKSADQSPAAAPASPSVVSPAANTVSSASTVAPSLETAPAPAQPRIRTAPPGSYFIAQRVSVVTDSGVFAVMPGDQVKLLSHEKNGKVRVLLGKQEIEVREDQITKELDSAGRPIMTGNVPKGAVAAGP